MISKSFNSFKSCPREGATSRESQTQFLFQCFKSCPREGGNREYCENFLMIRVSSHAPAKGATAQSAPPRPFVPCFKSCPREGGNPLGFAKGNLDEVSSHAPAKGATKVQAAADRRDQCFKSCPREGGNSLYRVWRDGQVTVSSHAPAKGATFVTRNPQYTRPFQVMPPRRGQPIDRARLYAAILFQVMPPRRGQLLGNAMKEIGWEVSSHAPAKGATAISHNFYHILLHESLNLFSFWKQKF